MTFQLKLAALGGILLASPSVYPGVLVDDSFLGILFSPVSLAALVIGDVTFDRTLELAVALRDSRCEAPEIQSHCRGRGRTPRAVGSSTSSWASRERGTGLGGDAMGQIRGRLAKLVGQPKEARLTRGYPGDPIHNGFVLGIGRDLVLLHQFHGFYPEGYTALRVADIKRVRSGEHERFWEAMLRGEGLMGRVGIRYEVPLDDFRSLLGALHGRGQHVIIECESREMADDDEFLIGQVVALDDESVSIRHFDSMGAWYEEASVSAYGDITQVQFDTPYINTITMYPGKQPTIQDGKDPASVWAIPLPECVSPVGPNLPACPRR